MSNFPLTVVGSTTCDDPIPVRNPYQHSISLNGGEPVCDNEFAVCCEESPAPSDGRVNVPLTYSGKTLLMRVGGVQYKLLLYNA